MRKIQNRWSNLRTCFKRELNEQRKVNTGKAMKQKRKYRYFDRLLFLTPTVTDRPSMRIRRDSRDTVQEDKIDKSSKFEEYSVCSPQPSTPPPACEERNFSNYEETFFDISNVKSDEDEDKLFCLSLVNLFKTIPFTHKIDAKIEVMHVLKKYQRFKPNPASSFMPTTFADSCLPDVSKSKTS